MTKRHLWVDSVYSPTASLASGTAPSALKDLGLTGSETPEEIEMRRKKLLAAGADNPMQRYGSAAMSLFGSRAPSYGAQY